MNNDDRKEYEIRGEQKYAILNKIFLQTQEWNITIPDVPAFMLHFGLNDFYNTGETEFWLANEIEAGYCAKFLFVFNGQTCPYHYHKIKHETFYILKGMASMNINGRVSKMEQGERFAMEPGTKHSFTGEDGPCLLLEISMPSIRGDSFFDDHRIGKNGTL